MKLRQSISRRQFLGAGSAALLTGTIHGAPKRPNIVLILVDDMGFSDIACYGSEIPTPNLDRLAAKGVRFTQFYNTARCSPTRASLLTGLYPHQAGMGHLDGMIVKDSKGYRGRLSEESVTIAEVLRASGYFTAASGKWHVGSKNGTPPWQRGFDRSLNAVGGTVYFPNQCCQPNTRIYMNSRPLPLDSPELGKDWYATDLWVDYGLRFIDEARKENKPFFLYLAPDAPHFPLMAPQADIARYRGKYMAGWDKLREDRYQRQIRMGLIDPQWPLSKRPPDSPAWDSLSQEEKLRFDHQMAIYAAMIDRIDRAIGTLLAGLDRRGELDNTLVLFLSDNGGNGERGPAGRYSGNPPGGPDSAVFIGMNWATLNNTPFFRYKHFTHEGGISTPLIAHWPSRIPRRRHGQFIQDPGHLIDIMATAVDVAGANYPQSFNGNQILPMEGISLMPALLGKPLKRPKPIYFMHEGNCAIRSGKWKLVLKYMDPWELYDMEADRTETRNLAGQYPEIAKELAAQWDAWAKRSYVDPWTGPRRTDWGEVPK